MALPHACAVWPVAHVARCAPGSMVARVFQLFNAEPAAASGEFRMNIENRAQDRQFVIIINNSRNASVPVD